MRLALAMVAAISSLAAADEARLVPPWAIAGIAWVETTSKVDEDGIWHWQNHKRGKSGERGMMQMTEEVFDETRAKWGWRDTFADLDNPVVSLAYAYCHLIDLREHTVDWTNAVMAYNVGLHGLTTKPMKARRYLAKIRAAPIVLFPTDMPASLRFR
jgi:hypothetical protein